MSALLLRFARRHWLPVLLLGTVVAFLLDLCFGAVDIPLTGVLRALLQHPAPSDEPVWQTILLQVRLPKALTALCAGAALAVGGLLMQTLFRNPLAGPDVLGISAGASLGVSALLLASGGLGIAAVKGMGLASGSLLAGAAAAGAGLVLLIVLLLASRVQDAVVLLLVGMMMGATTLSVVSIWQYYSAPEQLQDYLLWTFGSLGGVPPAQIALLAGITLLGLLLAWVSAKPLDALLLGEDYARSLGHHLRRSRFFIILATSLLAGGVTAFCGPIAFIGIAVPHVARGWLAASSHRKLIPATALLGALALLLCDVLTALPGHAAVLPINIVSSLLGAPVVIFLLLRSRSLQRAFH